MHAIGTDIVENKRIEATVRKFGDRFLNRIFTPDELAYCMKKVTRYQCLAARFAAKEAFMKAIGTGWGPIAFKEVEVLNLQNGRPVVKLHGNAARFAGRANVSISISHTNCCSTAVVLISDH